MSPLMDFKRQLITEIRVSYQQSLKPWEVFEKCQTSVVSNSKVNIFLNVCLGDQTASVWEPNNHLQAINAIVSLSLSKPSCKETLKMYFMYFSAGQ